MVIQRTEWASFTSVGITADTWYLCEKGQSTLYRKSAWVFSSYSDFLPQGMLVQGGLIGFNPLPPSPQLGLSPNLSIRKTMSFGSQLQGRFLHMYRVSFRQVCPQGGQNSSRVVYPPTKPIFNHLSVDWWAASRRIKLDINIMLFYMYRHLIKLSIHLYLN